jgi:hypothetical protein
MDSFAGILLRSSILALQKARKTRSAATGCALKRSQNLSNQTR